MLKIGIIGLGDIARKAYLPVITRHKAEIHLFTRNKETLSDISSTYRLEHTHESLDSIIHSGIQAAFVHSSTASHAEIIEALLHHHIHVYVDKPVTYDYASTKKLFALAEQNNLNLAVGFNRRFAPAYTRLKDLQHISMIVLQKNRNSQPGDVRTFIYDDFIHVIDTLLYLFPYPVKTVSINGLKKDGQLHHAVVQFTAESGELAIGIMNRDAGTVEEKIEVFTPKGKWIVDNLVDAYIHREKKLTQLGTDDWEPMLHKRGFEQIIEKFMGSIAMGVDVTTTPHPLVTHKICEDAVTLLESLP